jgi:hypothetical protein
MISVLTAARWNRDVVIVMDDPEQNIQEDDEYDYDERLDIE